MFKKILAFTAYLLVSGVVLQAMEIPPEELKSLQEKGGEKIFHLYTEETWHIPTIQKIIKDYRLSDDHLKKMLIRGTSFLSAAIAAAPAHVIQELILLGHNPNGVPGQDMSPLLLLIWRINFPKNALSRDDGWKLVDLLLQHGGDLLAINDRGHTAAYELGSSAPFPSCFFRSENLVPFWNCLKMAASRLPQNRHVEELRLGRILFEFCRGYAAAANPQDLEIFGELLTKDPLAAAGLLCGIGALCHEDTQNKSSMILKTTLDHLIQKLAFIPGVKGPRRFCQGSGMGGLWHHLLEFSLHAHSGVSYNIVGFIMNRAPELLNFKDAEGKTVVDILQAGCGKSEKSTAQAVSTAPILTKNRPENTLEETKKDQLIIEDISDQQPGVAQDEAQFFVVPKRSKGKGQRSKKLEQADVACLNGSHQGLPCRILAFKLHNQASTKLENVRHVLKNSVITYSSRIVGRLLGKIADSDSREKLDSLHTISTQLHCIDNEKIMYDSLDKRAIDDGLVNSHNEFVRFRLPCLIWSQQLCILGFYEISCAYANAVNVDAPKKIIVHKFLWPWKKLHCNKDRVDKEHLKDLYHYIQLNFEQILNAVPNSERAFIKKILSKFLERGKKNL